MLNKVMLHGRLGEKPELKTTSGGVTMARFSIAVDRDFKNQDGNRECDWFNVTAWRNQAEFVSKWFDKGDQIIVDGRLQARSYTAQDGSKRNAVDVIAEHVHFCGRRNKDTDPSANMAELGFRQTEDDDLPF